MSLLFQPAKIKNMTLRNRFVRSATHDAMSDRKTGHISAAQIKLFEELAAGGVGLIVTGIAHVHPSGQLSPLQNSITGDDCIAGLKQLTGAVHAGGAKIAVQLFHAGRECARFFKTRNKQALSPSVVEDDPYFSQDYREMTVNEIREIIAAFGDAAGRAVQAGFDAVQIHGAHGYLLSQFLSPQTNRRRDEWGGSLENRLRFHHEVYRAVRAAVGEDIPVMIKIGVADGFRGGLEFSEGRRVAQLLVQWGFDALEISQGVKGVRFSGTEYRTRINTIEQEGYFRQWCREIRQAVSVPCVMVGGLRSWELIEEVMQKGEADFISLSRPLIKEPGLVNDWQNGNRHRAGCISCNQCLEAITKGGALYCHTN